MTRQPNILFRCRVQVARHSSKKNEKEPRRAGHRVFIGKSQKAKFAEDILKHKLQIEKLKQRVDTISCDLNAKMIFYFPETVYFTKKGDRSKKLPDTSNLYELPQDVLQTVKIIENDTQICSHDGSRRLPSEDGLYWLEIELTTPETQDLSCR